MRIVDTERQSKSAHKEGGFFMGANIVNLNINPCKMCMPMGTVSALSGVQGCMSILHGSQGCATYIRRHMATHYNEPIDIASSSLTEEGTVFGGEANLIKGLENLMALYEPSVIGISTTCLAETIGEDVPQMVERFYETHPQCTTKIVNIAAAGYESSQYEGFFKATRALVEQLTVPSEKGAYINILTPMISPADTRWLKATLGEMGVEYILLPDLSENLDGGYNPQYEKLKGGGTTIEDIARMSGAVATLELSSYIKEEHSAGRYLEDAFGVPLCRLPLPCGIGALDAFYGKLEEFGGVITQPMKDERGRYLDAMVDAHKHSAPGRVAIFGEPDLTASLVSLCCELGTVPVSVTTGSRCSSWKADMEAKVAKVASLQFVEPFLVQEDADFDQVEANCLKNGANLLIGSSDGRRIAEKYKIPLLRCAFPIHDHVGGQRLQILGFAGAHYLLEGIANAMIDRLHTSYKEELADKYLQGEKIIQEKTTKGKMVKKKAVQMEMVKTEKEKSERVMKYVFNKEEMNRRTLSHPCYTKGKGSCQTARMHLPIAPKCNIQCNYCVRKFDCVNESRPGVTTAVLKPEEAVAKFHVVKAAYPNLSVVGIAGPGDALANFDETKATLEAIRKVDQEITFCLSTNGLMLPVYADQLVELGVTHVTVTMSTVDPKIGGQIYKHVDYLGTRFKGVEGATILLANQLSGIKMMADRGAMVKVNCVAIKGVNHEHLLAVAEKAKSLGAFMTNIMAHIPVEGSAFEHLEKLTPEELEGLRTGCEGTIRQMRHCRQCRADAIGTLDDDQSAAFAEQATSCKQTVCSESCKREAPITFATPKISTMPTTQETHDTYKVAVATQSGVMVDVHFGQAKEFYIYETDGAKMKLLEKRRVQQYCNGKENCEEDMTHAGKMEGIIATIADCNYVLSLKIGESPKEKLEKRGIIPITSYDYIHKQVQKCTCSE